MQNSKEKLGVALVGLGEYATQQLMPALEQTKYCYLAGLVSGSPDKLKKYQAAFGLPDNNLYNYESFDRIRENSAIDIVYIVLPNALHAEYAIRAAEAGKQVICEKPMAMSMDECSRIIKAVELAGVRFSMGYRLHFDPFNKEMMRLGQQEVFGPLTSLELKNSMFIGDSSPWRLDVNLSGGGPLVNNGIYCVQAAIYITGKFPVAVAANFAPVTDANRFREVEEGIQWTLFFDNGLEARCESSYSKEQNLMHANAEHGRFQLQPAYAYTGLKGKTPAGTMRFKTINQQALQMDDFAQCILANKETRVPAEMGMRDVEIMQAIYNAADSGKKIALNLQHYAPIPVY
ncbi:Gfo/Idh/MocA family oxidoreductase [Flavihumibacter sp. CACIAM 22H1]|uniref:Gfo/Idh/MocA family protein n=1 Tax=Flavihumibacter sp. CACIAM 22H1 TaxID=1812911 RepID=UPI0007A85DA0|nr:Gfo/Idh/MocA family oxidoreductase [Flavihumibacter sp. CACIAM 22H1]KYP14134.1 MAG: glucose-fructose oxidoreductase [Flavihumibacter sp. CACIAM 22H1]